MTFKKKKNTGRREDKLGKLLLDHRKKVSLMPPPSLTKMTLFHQIFSNSFHFRKEASSFFPFLVGLAL